MYRYEQVTGRLLHNDKHVATGYSGRGEGLNNPLFQNVHDLGPIPQGSYFIGEPYDSKDHGKFVMRLLAQPGTNTHGRSGFLMHGDEVGHVGEHLASHGCIILSRAERQAVYDSDDTLLVVVSGVAV